MSFESGTEMISPFSRPSLKAEAAYEKNDFQLSGGAIRIRVSNEHGSLSACDVAVQLYELSSPHWQTPPFEIMDLKFPYPLPLYPPKYSMDGVPYQPRFSQDIHPKATAVFDLNYSRSESFFTRILGIAPFLILKDSLPNGPVRVRSTSREVSFGPSLEDEYFVSFKVLVSGKDLSPVGLNINQRFPPMRVPSDIPHLLPSTPWLP